jgi:SMI1 / KNR4 family (SUKH-1)
MRMHERLAQIREKLDRLRSADAKHQVFGARRVGDHGHAYRECPVLDASAVARLEADCGATLPDEVRAFLTKVHGGGPGPGYGLDVWGEPPKASRPFPFTRADFDALVARWAAGERANLPMTDDEDPDSCWPPGTGFLPIAHLGCGVYDAVAVNGELAGTIWCCDMAWRPHVTEGRPSTFLDWYEAWLDRNLAPDALAKLLR